MAQKPNSQHQKTTRKEKSLMSGIAKKIMGADQEMLEEYFGITHETLLAEIELHLIDPNPEQPRKYFDPESLLQLAESIKEKGILQPVLLKSAANGRFHLVAGERRFRAAKMAGLTKLPALIKDIKDDIEAALLENIQRENLNPVEEAEALLHLSTKYNYTQTELGALLKKSQPSIALLLSINYLPGNIKDECRTMNNITRTHLQVVAKGKDIQEMQELFDTVKTGKISVSQLKKIRKMKETPIELLLKKIASITSYIGRIDFSDIDAEKKEMLMRAADKINTVVKANLSPGDEHVM